MSGALDAASMASLSAVPALALDLRAGELHVALRADLGAAIAGFWCGGLPVLRSVPAADLPSARASGCYPLVPYSNRIGHARFRWQGRSYATRPNFDASNPHSVHGVAWQRPWQVSSQRADDVVLELRHPGDDDWPFAFTARQAFALTPGGLSVGLHVTNDAALTAPVGLGWHPYFVKRTRSRLHAELTQRWESDPATQLPTRRVAQPGIDGDIAHLDFDHCFEGWAGPARLRDEKLSIRLSSSLPYLVVYTPPTKPIYCVEPVSHVSNAIHMAEPALHGLRALAPGESMQAWMKIEVSRV